MARGNGDRPIRFAVARSAATFLGPPAIANPMLRIEADVLIPGLGDPIKDGALVVDGTTIAYAGPIEGAPSAAGAVVLNVPALMPGMWDVHGHFMGIRTLNVEEIARTPLAVLAARATKDAGVAGELDHPVHAQFSREELEAIVSEAARADRVVAAHCHGKPGIMAALRAGCRTIEHGSFLDEEAADLMRERDAILVPTRFIIERLVRVGKEAGIAAYAYRKAVAINEQHQKALRIAIRKGVRMATGSDIFASAGGPAGWGLNGHEVGHLVEAGMKPVQAIEAATATGPLTIGPQAPKSGQLKAGYDADFLALAKSPLDRIGILAEPENIRKVWISGEPVKDLPL